MIRDFDTISIDPVLQIPSKNPLNICSDPFAFSGSRHEPEPEGRSDHDQWQFGASGFEPERLGQVQLCGYKL